MHADTLSLGIQSRRPREARVEEHASLGRGEPGASPLRCYSARASVGLSERQTSHHGAEVDGEVECRGLCDGRP